VQVERFLEEQDPLEEDDEAEQVSAAEELEVAVPKKKGGGFSRPCALSEPLQALLGEETMARSEVRPSPTVRVYSACRRRRRQDRCDCYVAGGEANLGLHQSKQLAGRMCIRSLSTIRS
jgi:hypothetical protein